MRTLLVVLAVLAISGCKSSPSRSKVDPDFDRFEARWVAEGELLLARARKEKQELTDADLQGIREFHAIYISKRGVFVNRTRVAGVDELEAKREPIAAAIAQNVALMPTVNMSPTTVIDLDAEPVAVGLSVLRLFAGKPFFLSRPAPPSTPHRSTDAITNEPLRLTPSPNTELPQLSVLLDASAIWVGASKTDEFREIPDRGADRDYDKLETVLRDYKESDVFAERRDIEIAAVGGTTEALLQTITVAGRIGFGDIAVLPRAQLSADPRL